MANENDSITYLCKYQIPSLSFILEDKEIVVSPTDIISFTKYDDYDLNIRSMLKITLRMETRKKLWLIKNKRKLKCKFALDMIGIHPTEDHTDINENIIISPEEIFNMEFSVFFNEDEDNYDAGLVNSSLMLDEEQISDAPLDEINFENYGEFENYLDIFLFSTDILDPSNKIVNEVYTKDTLQQIVAHMLTKSEHKKVLMSPFENDEVYNELLIPAHPVYESLNYLENYYGFYETGAIIYYDLDTLYIVNTNGKVTAKQEEEWVETTVLVDTSGKQSPENGMIRRNGEKINYLFAEEKNFHVNKPSIMNNDTIGSDLTIVTIDGTDLTEVKADQSYMETRNKRPIYIKKGDNKYTGKILEARLEENEVIIQIASTNLDIRAFAPNKVYNIIFDNEDKQEKYGKWKYRLCRVYHNISLEGSEWAKSVHQFTLKKTKTDHEVEESNDDV